MSTTRIDGTRRRLLNLTEFRQSLYVNQIRARLIDQSHELTDLIALILNYCTAYIWLGLNTSSRQVFRGMLRYRRPNSVDEIQHPAETAEDCRMDRSW